nr:hypothetical protein [Tanacetum cinerariifolium]GEZ42293.1 hypothetical protein [Tanacetum cinerariifolium]
MFVDPESSTQADKAQSSRVPVPLPKDPYEAIRQAYLVGTNIESEPFEGKARTPESPHIVAPPTYLPLTHTTPALVPILLITTRMALRVLPTMSPGLSFGIAELAAIKEDEDVEESLDFDSKSEGAEDEGPTTEDEDHAARDEGLATGVDGLGVDDESYGLDDKSYGLDDKSHSVDDESPGLDDKVRDVEINGLGLDKEEEEAVPGGQHQAAPVEGTAIRTWPTLTTWIDPDDGMVYDVPVYPPSSPPVQTPRSPEWTSGLLLISPSPSVVPSSVSSPMIPLTVPSPIASPMATSIATIPAGYDDHRLVHDMLLQQTALQRELQEMRVHVTALEQERDCRERGDNRKMLDREWSRGMLERVVVIELES